MCCNLHWKAGIPKPCTWCIQISARSSWWSWPDPKTSRVCHRGLQRTTSFQNRIVLDRISAPLTNSWKPSCGRLAWFVRQNLPGGNYAAIRLSGLFLQWINAWPAVHLLLVVSSLALCAQRGFTRLVLWHLARWIENSIEATECSDLDLTVIFDELSDNAYFTVVSVVTYRVSYCRIVYIKKNIYICFFEQIYSNKYKYVNQKYIYMYLYIIILCISARPGSVWAQHIPPPCGACVFCTFGSRCCGSSGCSPWYLSKGNKSWRKPKAQAHSDWKTIQPSSIPFAYSLTRIFLLITLIQMLRTQRTFNTKTQNTKWHKGKVEGSMGGQGRSEPYLLSL